ncbi:MAG: hypothetical protein L0L39_03630 [Atopostipes suicloacalis]|nr:hypothetical protein [Atopostipes suicloacalis]
MNSKKRNRLINIIGAIIGAIWGYFKPLFFQQYLPIIAIGSALLYFFASQSVNKNPDKKKVTDFSDYSWYGIVRFLYGLLVGGALTSTFLLVKEIF